MNATKISGPAVLVFAILAFFAWLISWSIVTFFTVSPQLLTVVKIGGNTKQVLLILAFLAAAIGLIFKPKSSGVDEKTVGKRTSRHFRFNGNIVPIIEKWTQENKFQVVETAGNERVYRKGLGWTAPMMLKVKIENQEISLETWIQNSFVMRLRSFFILPEEMGIESGGLINALDRKSARNAFNLLLEQLGQSPVQ